MTTLKAGDVGFGFSFQAGACSPIDTNFRIGLWTLRLL